MMRATSRGMIALLAAGAVFAQPRDTRPAYEAASVKINTSGSGHSSSDGSKGQVVMTNQTLKRLIERAYNVKPLQVTGPGWMEDVRFDIAAKYPPDTKNDDHLLMLRTLLEDRFKLAVHRESKDMPGYALVVAKSGFKLKPVEPGGSGTDHNGGRVQTMTATKNSMAQLADFVARTLGEMVVDQTGIEGVYDFELRWTNEDQNPSATDLDGVPSLFTALEETLGLRLQPQKVPVEIVVVDHVERVPTEN
ncbi:MAG: TIGR03435 family protein [Bryobacteraceae bacterium]